MKKLHVNVTINIIGGRDEFVNMIRNGIYAKKAGAFL